MKNYSILHDRAMHLYGTCLERIHIDCAAPEKQAQKECAMTRFSEEIQIITGNGFDKKYALMSMVVEHARKENRLVKAAGNAAYSYIAYLAGITEINPLDRGYEPEMAFGVKHNREPYFTVLIPEGYAKEIREYLVSVFGETGVRREGKTDFAVNVEGNNTMTGSAAEGEENCVRICLTEDPLVSEVERALQSEKRAAGRRMCGGAFPGEDEARQMGSRRFMEELRAAVSGFIRNRKGVDGDISGHVDEFLDEMLDGTWQGLIGTVAVIRGQGVWRAAREAAAVKPADREPVKEMKGNRTGGMAEPEGSGRPGERMSKAEPEGSGRPGEEMSKAETWGDNKARIVCTRDQVKTWATDLTGETGEAYQIMEWIRKGHGGEAHVQQAITSYPGAERLAAYAHQVRYMVYEGSCLPYAQLLWALAEANCR